VDFLPRWFCRRTERWERFLFSSTAIMLALLLVSQLAMLNFKVRSLLSRVESLEGLPYQEHGWVE